MSFRLRMGIGLCLLLTMIVGLPPFFAQDEVILTLSVMEWERDIYREDVFDNFYAAHPGVKVVLVSPSQDESYASAPYDADEYFAGVQRLAGSADVLSISSYQIALEATRAGLFLDLSPLVASDATLPVEDYFPAIWQAFQWDQGIWALPVSASVDLVVYNVDAFDAAGLPYPQDSWTLADFADTAQTLAERDENGEVMRPGMMAWNVAALYQALYDEPFYDPASASLVPRFDTPELADFLEQWHDLQLEGSINNPRGQGSYDYDAVPLRIETAWRLYNQGFGADNENWWAVPLPGGVSTLNTEGFAISAGTPHPELAYELVKYLSESPYMTSRMFGATPARRSLVGVEVEDDRFFMPDVPAEVQALMEEAIANAIPAAQLQFSDYVNLAANQMLNDENPLPAQAALQEAEAEARANLETAASLRSAQAVIVVTPVPTPVLTGGEVALQFRIQVPISPLPNREEWERLALDFVAEDPEVGHIELLTGFSSTPDEELDCFFDSFGERVAYMNLADPGILSLDPLMDADPAFDRADLLPRVLDQVSSDNRLWAYPVVIYPEVLWYNADLFEMVNAIDPEGGWNVTEFTDTLQALATQPDTLPAFVPQTGGSTYLWMLMAAYGVLPYDHRVDPPTLDLEDPVTRETLRQVLDLARDGYIHYQALASFGGGGFLGTEAPIYTDTLSTESWRLRNRSNPDIVGPSYRLTTYPTGSTFTPMSYSLGAVYIDDSSLHVEACYRWATTIAGHPELFSGIPARLSQLADPALAAALGDDVMNLFQTYAGQLAQPNVIVFGRYGVTSSYRGAFIEQRWVNRAFDRYVLEDADLDAELDRTVEDIAAYRQCLEGVPDYTTLGADATPEEQTALFRQMAECGIALDPELAEMFVFPDD